MSQHTIEERVIALAALYQATALVQQVARSGQVESEPFRRSIESILVTDAKNSAEIYGGIEGVAYGLKALTQQTASKNPQDVEITRYALSLMHLERKLGKHPELQQRLGQGIENVITQAEHFSSTHENVIANLGGLYSDTISTIPPKIMIDGEQGHLNNPANANKVRALLLAGMRAVILWRQCGGNRFQLLFQRKKLLATAQALLSNLSLPEDRSA